VTPDYWTTTPEAAEAYERRTAPDPEPEMTASDLADEAELDRWREQDRREREAGRG
jgi:hypothetical protein